MQTKQWVYSAINADRSESVPRACRRNRPKSLFGTNPGSLPINALASANISLQKGRRRLAMHRRGLAPARPIFRHIGFYLPVGPTGDTRPARPGDLADTRPFLAFFSRAGVFRRPGLRRRNVGSVWADTWLLSGHGRLGRAIGFGSGEFGREFDWGGGSAAGGELRPMWWQMGADGGIFAKFDQNE